MQIEQPTNKRPIQWFGEFIIIVVGVLVAMAVDDLVNYRADRELETHLLDRLQEDLLADAADLALAQMIVVRRQWLFSALEQAVADGEPVPPPPDHIVRLEQTAERLEAVGRLMEAGGARHWQRPLEAPLLVLQGHPEFDFADGSYQEMLATGAFRALQDRQLRSVIIAYYRIAEDDSANVMGSEGYSRRFREELLQSGVALTDPLSIDQLADIVRKDEYLAARVRDAQAHLYFQAFFLQRIEEARVALERLLANRQIN
jgi:hypothetical protein